MTSEERDLIIGRTVRQNKENEELIACLQSQFRQLAEEYQHLQWALNNDPFLIGFADEPIPALRDDKYRVYGKELFDLPKLRSLLADYKAAIQKQAALNEELIKLGVKERPITIEISEPRRVRRV